MPKLMIDGREITVEQGSTILEAAGRLGIEIPTLCHLKGIQEEASCQICVVHETGSGRLLPACAMRATEGMKIVTGSEAVHKARRVALQLLVNDHQGNCLAPCQKACPLHLNIPEMIRLLRQGKLIEAQQLIHEALIFPGIVGRVCPAYCERSCGAFRPEIAPEPIEVRSLHRYISELAVGLNDYSLPERKATAINRKVAIVGAGVTGLTVAFVLLQAGYTCHLFEAKAEPGGRLREEFPKTVLPKEIVNRECKRIHDIGAQFVTNTRVGKDISLKQLRAEYEAVALAWGKVDTELLEENGLDFSEKGIRVEPGTYRTQQAGIFAGGTAVHSGQPILRSIADGKGVAASVQQYLAGQSMTPQPRRFISHSQKPMKRQKAFPAYQDASREEHLDQTRRETISLREAIPLQEAERCLQCDCSKAETCKLRQLATDYQIAQKQGEIDSETKPSVVIYDTLAYEAGKCIHCGICIRITEKANTRCAFSFMGRGYRTTLGIPVNVPVDEAFRRIIPELVANCPTGALGRSVGG